MSIPTSFQYQSPPEAALKLQYIGSRISELPAPAAIIDVAVARANCDSMLAAAENLGVSFRAHVKTHKTVELTKLQVAAGRPARRDIRLIVSTIAEIEHLLPWLLRNKKEGVNVDIVYGFPASPSSLRRIATFAHLLGGFSVSLIVDSAEAVDVIAKSRSLWPIGIPVFIKIDTGYHRAGVELDSTQFKTIVDKLGKLRTEIWLRGLYSHMGNSYGGNSPADAINGLQLELEGLQAAGKYVSHVFDKPFDEFRRNLIYTVGATPTATAAQNLTSDSEAALQLRRTIGKIRKETAANLDIELHAGVYPLLDLQQLATHARPPSISYALGEQHRFVGLTYSSIGLRILVEVASTYPHRVKPEALIAAGTLALGREPCKSYPGWGVVTPWSDNLTAKKDLHDLDGNPNFYDPDQQSGTMKGWIISRISQEHGILTWEGPREDMRKLKIGERLLVWPNHACVAGAGFGWYFVVDSASDDPDMVRDIWVRCRGW